MTLRSLLVVTVTTGVVGLSCGAGSAQQANVAGTRPDARPDGAPRMQAVARDAGWMARATAGVVEPHPSSLKFLNDQGNWYTPFDRPGMPGPYDIRRLHRVEPAKPSAN